MFRISSPHKIISFVSIQIIIALIVSSCSVSRHIADDELYLRKVVLRSDSKDVADELSLHDVIQQQPNTKWFGAKIPMRVYSLSGGDSLKRINRFLRKLGEAPVIYSPQSTEQTISQMKQILSNNGYYHSEVSAVQKVKGKTLDLEYDVKLNDRFHVNTINRQIADTVLAASFVTLVDTLKTPFVLGAPLSTNLLADERNRISSILRNNGYYQFNKDNITFLVDTARYSTQADVTVNVLPYLANDCVLLHRQFAIGRINYLPESDGKVHFRRSFLMRNNFIRTGSLFCEQNLRQTYTNFTSKNAVAFANIILRERTLTDSLDVDISIIHSPSYSIGYDIEATNSAGDLGAALSGNISRKNLFRGSETLSFKLRGAYEFISGLEGYTGNHYVELGGEIKLSFPNFTLPFVNALWAARANASTELSVQYNLQDRPEFQRRVLTGAWRYRWNGVRSSTTHKLDLLEVNYIYMPRISPKFKHDYIDSIGATNAILKYNYENILITKLGYTYYYNSLGTQEQTYGKNAFTFRVNVETSGNVLRGLTSLVNGKRNSSGQYTFCGIAYAQYFRTDIDFAKSWRIDKNNSLAFHTALGVAVPYGNSSVLPFEKRYFSGGANSLRGWTVRALGPGGFRGGDGAVNFINQSGDIKFDASLEYRSHLFWKLNAAVFVDAGNIWTIRSYDDQPEGVFRFSTFWKQIALSYGIGLRLDLGFFILRFDAGMKAINPAYKGRDHFPIYHPDFSRDFAFHFAIGLPF